MPVSKTIGKSSAVYIDANLLVALCIREAKSDLVQQWLSEQEMPLVTSDWAIAEVTSALGLKVRRGEASPLLARKTIDYLHQKFLLHFERWPIEAGHFYLAERLMRKFSLALRTPDALHLAVCLSHRDCMLATADAQLHAAALAYKQKSVRVY